MRVRQSGVIVYTLPELMDGDSPLEDFLLRTGKCAGGGFLAAPLSGGIGVYRG
jgi:hypothetical protein